MGGKVSIQEPESRKVITELFDSLMFSIKLLIEIGSEKTFSAVLIFFVLNNKNCLAEFMNSAKLQNNLSRKKSYSANR